MYNKQKSNRPTYNNFTPIWLLFGKNVYREWPQPIGGNNECHGSVCDVKDKLHRYREGEKDVGEVWKRKLQ